MSLCAYCGTELNPELSFCPRCLALVVRPTRRGRQWMRLMLGVGAFLGVVCAVTLGEQRLVGRQRGVVLAGASGPVAATHGQDAVQDDATRLLMACGPADRDLSSTQTDPPAPIPFRVLEYERAGLQLSFSPDAQSGQGSSSYRWVLTAVTDAATGRELSPGEVLQRLPCWAAANNHSAPSRTTSSEPIAGGPADAVGTAR